MKIEDILKKKGRKVVTVRPDTPVSTVMHHLRAEHVGCVVISEDRQHIDGIIAVRDIVYAMAEHEERLRKMKGAEILDTPVSDIMTRSVRTCKPSDTLRAAIKRMNKFKVLHLPVVDGDKMVGIISIDAVVKYAIDAMDSEIAVLRDTLVAHRPGAPGGD